MKKLIILLLLLPVFVDAQIWVDTVYHKGTPMRMIQYEGEWVHKDGVGSWPKNDEAFLIWRFWGFGIDIFTEKSPNHSYYILDIDGKLDTISVNAVDKKLNRRTYFNHRLNYGNHKVIMRGGLFVLNKFVLLVDSNPFPKPCIDTIYHNVDVDSVVVNFKDSTIIFLKDSLVFLDTLLINYIDSVIHIFDTIQIKIPKYIINYDTIVIKKDSVVIKTIQRPGPCIGTEDKSWILWAFIGTGIVLILFIVLYFTKKTN